jgi:hypothetical protein
MSAVFPIGHPGRGRQPYAVQRPQQCPKGHRGKIYLDGLRPNGRKHATVLFRCEPSDGAKSHRVRWEERMQWPKPDPVEGAAHCDECEQIYPTGFGAKLPEKFWYSYHQAADLFIEIGRGESFRASSKALRWNAGRRHRLYAAMPSDEGQLAGLYVSDLAPVVIEPLRVQRWPAYAAVDTLPRERRVIKNGIADTDPAGEIAVAGEHFFQDRRRRSRPIAAMFMGSKDNISWETFLTSLDGRPEWIVVDGDGGVMLALKNLKWAEQGTIVFRCEAHLLMNAEDAARADGLIPWVRTEEGELRASDELADMRRLLTPRRGRQPEWQLADLFLAMRHSLESERNWRAFKSAVRKHVPPGKQALRKWMADNEALVMRQLVYKADQPSAPVSIGSVESVIRRMKGHLSNRLRQFGNERRLNLTLALMVLEMRGTANRQLYHRLLHEYFLVQAQRWQIAARKPLLFDQGESSMDRRIVQARVDQAKYAVLEGQATAEARRMAQLKANMKTAGLRSRSRRDEEDAIDVPPNWKNVTIADIADLNVQYDQALNGGVPSSDVRAGSNAPVTWMCKRKHTWQRAPAGRARTRSRCPYCHGTHLVAPEDSLLNRYPLIAAEWHPTLNAPRTPGAVKPQSNRAVWWVCPDGHNYQRRVNHRVGHQLGCPHPDHKPQPVGSARERQTVARTSRRARRLARAGDDLLAGNLDASGAWQRKLSEAALELARGRLNELLDRITLPLLAQLLDRAERTVQQMRTRAPISAAKARQIDHLFITVETLGNADADRWFVTWHPGLRARPIDFLIGEWRPNEPQPAMVLEVAMAGNRLPRP